MSVLTITNENFETEVLASSTPVLVDFWAEWCGPCRMLSPLVDAVAESADDFAVGKVNVDAQQALAERFKVMTIPTLIVFKDGKEAARSVGVISQDKIEDLVKNA